MGVAFRIHVLRQCNSCSKVKCDSPALKGRGSAGIVPSSHAISCTCRRGRRNTGRNAMAITVCPVTQGFAAEIGDVDLGKPIAPDDVAAIKDAFTTYAVLIFPEQRLSQDQHLDFARLFGPLETTIAVFRKDQTLRLRPELSAVSNLASDNEAWAKTSEEH